MGKGNTLIESLKIILMSTGALFIAFLLSLSFLPFLTSATSALPPVWSSFKSWLRPPFLYFIINAIILTLAASSRLPHAPPTPDPHPHPTHLTPAPDDVVSATEPDDSTSVPYYDAVSVKDVDVDDVGFTPELEEEEKGIIEEVRRNMIMISQSGEGDESTVDEMFMWNPPPPLERQHPLYASSDLLSSERLPLSSRFGHHRRFSRARPAEGGKALGMAKPTRYETLESTWEAITKGRHVPLTRHLKKSDTWENQCRQINLLDDPSPLSMQEKKSETFKDPTNHSPSLVPASRLKKEPSLSQDELNRRVEAFINKFNEEMRLQRQESIQQFMEKINRAA